MALGLGLAFFLVPIALVLWFWGTFDILKDPDILLDILGASVISVLIYGPAIFFFGKFVSRRNHPMVASVFGLLSLGLWIPCLFLAWEVAALIPLVWGHAGEMFLVPFFGASVVVFAWGILMYRKMTSNPTVESDARNGGARGSP